MGQAKIRREAIAAGKPDPMPELRGLRSPNRGVTKDSSTTIRLTEKLRSRISWPQVLLSRKPAATR